MNPNNSTPAIANDVASVENKHLLWSILTEEQVFNGLREDRLSDIIDIFETAINTVKNTRTHKADTDASSANLAALNKDVIRRVIADINANESKYKKYKAADIQEARIRDITSKLKLHEDDMKSFLVLKKPAEINFADSRTDDDRPIGEEMDQLIQAALAARARESRELEVMQSSNDTTNDKKSVSFTESVVDEAEAGLNLNAIVNKLKRNTASETPESKMLDNDVNVTQALREIRRELRDIKTLILLLRADRTGS